jgi:hypothetical protein
VVQHFVLFEVGRANVGDSGTRIPTSQLIKQWSVALEDSRVRVIASVGHTGNYIAEGDDTITAEDVAALMRQQNVRVAAFTAAEFVLWVGAAKISLSLLPDTPPGRRPTAGVVMDLDPTAGFPLLPPSSERIAFAPFAASRVRGVWKLDVLRDDGKALDRTEREGGWGSIATVMKQFAGGEWTARSMTTINRLRSRLQGSLPEPR